MPPGRFPQPLACAIALAAFLSLRSSPERIAPAGSHADDRATERIAGTVGGPVLVTPHGYGAPLDAGATTIWIWTETPIEPGDRVAVIGRLRTPRGFLDPGSEDRAALVASRGAEWELTASRLDHLGRDDGLVAWAWRAAAQIQRGWTARIDGDDAAAAALRGIVTGDRGRVPHELDQRWRAVGIYHVLSVSGLHLAVVAGLAFALLRRLLAASPWGGRIRPARWAAPVALALAILYTLITGGQLATIRALIVVSIVMVAQMLDRPVRLVDALGVAAIMILLWRPQDLFDPSFQLSFTAALTLALRPRMRGSWIRRWLVGGLSTSAWVALTTAPITALHFHQVAAGGVIGNLVLTPIVELVALPLGLAGVLLGSLGAPLVTVGVWIVARVDQLAGLVAHAVPVGTIALGSRPLVIVLVVLSLWLASRERRSRWGLVLWAALCCGWLFGRSPPPHDTLRVTFLDVGQGDAALVELPGGTTWLVDAGGVASTRTIDAATAPGTMITRTLELYGHDAIDLAIVSHPHPDHYLGLAALDVAVRELWAVTDGETPGPTGGLPSFEQVVASLAERGTYLGHPRLGSIHTSDGVELAVLAPRWQPFAGAPPQLAADPVRSVNDNSLVVAIRYAGRTLLFTGDIESEGEEALVEAGLSHVDIVKVAHHGSPTSSSPAFVEATSPAYAVISCGVANAFGFPSEAVLTRWRAAGARIERTDLDGAITVIIGADGSLDVERFAP